jgi:hypothetical protein
MASETEMQSSPSRQARSMSRRAYLIWVMALAPCGPLVGTAAAQSDLSLELGASQIGPPLGMEGSNARFLIGGLRASRYSTEGSGIFGSVLLGQTLNDTTGGNFLSGIVEGTLASRWTPSLTGQLDLRLMGYGVRTPFPYRAFAAEGGPSLRFRTPNVSLKVAALGGVGRSRLELWRVQDGPTRVFEDDLWRAGGTAELMVGPVTSSVGLVGGLHDTPGGSYQHVGGRFVLAGIWGLAEFRVDRWSTPEGARTTGGLAIVLPIGSAWNMRGYFGRTEPDPLTLARPGSGSGGFLIGRNMLPVEEAFDDLDRPYEVIRYGDVTSRIRVSVEPPVGTALVQLLGDFTQWEPLAMTREGDRWLIEVDVPVGTHHFGFLVDDEWYIPDDAPDVVPDEWGRLSATLVIEGVGS